MFKKLAVVSRSWQGFMAFGPALLGVRAGIKLSGPAKGGCDYHRLT